MLRNKVLCGNEYYFLGKIHCGRNAQLCKKLGVNRYPMWGMLKSKGAFELDHGKSTINNIIKFAQLGIKTTNVHALNAEESLSILQRDNGTYLHTVINANCILRQKDFCID